MASQNRQFTLKSSEQIGRIFEGGQRVSDARAMLIAQRNELGLVRLALAVGKRHGSAVRRNRVKRLCREAFRSVRESLPAGWDIVLMPRAGVEHCVEKLAQSLQNLCRRLPVVKEAPP